MRKILILFCLIIFFCGCATHKNIEDGIKGLGTYLAYSLAEKMVLTTIVCSAYYNEFKRFPISKEELETYFDSEKTKELFVSAEKLGQNAQKESQGKDETIKKIKAYISSLQSISKLKNGDLLITMSSQDLLPTQLNTHTFQGQEIKIIIHRTPEGSFKVRMPKDKDKNEIIANIINPKTE